MLEWLIVIQNVFLVYLVMYAVNQLDIVTDKINNILNDNVIEDRDVRGVVSDEDDREDGEDTDSMVNSSDKATYSSELNETSGLNSSNSEADESDVDRDNEKKYN